MCDHKSVEVASELNCTLHSNWAQEDLQKDCKLQALGSTCTTIYNMSAIYNVIEMLVTNTSSVLASDLGKVQVLKLGEANKWRAESLDTAVKECFV